MMSSSTPLNWHSTLRRLKKDDVMGGLGKELGILPGRKKSLEAMLSGAISKSTPILASAAISPVKVVNRIHKPNRATKKVVSEASATDKAESATAPPKQTDVESLEVSGAPRTPLKTPAADEVKEDTPLELTHLSTSHSPTVRTVTKALLSNTTDISKHKNILPRIPKQILRHQHQRPVRARKAKVEFTPTKPASIKPKGLNLAVPKPPIGTHPRAKRHPKTPLPHPPPIHTPVTDVDNASNRSASPTAPQWAGKGGLQHMKLVGVQKVAHKHGIDVSHLGQSLKKIKSHLKGHFNI